MSHSIRILIIIPTYNEAENISKLIPLVLKQDKRIEILVIDDNSPDGTASVVEKIMKKNNRIHLLKRATKMGLGTAYVEGFRYALKAEYDLIFEMDADFSHDPIEIPNFLKKTKETKLPDHPGRFSDNSRMHFRNSNISINKHNRYFK